MSPMLELTRIQLNNILALNIRSLGYHVSSHKARR